MRFLCEQTADQFLHNQQKSITLLGMSGVGKTTLVHTLPWERWFKFSGDYRIGTRYLDEAILDNIKQQAMQIPFLADLLRTDSIYICNNITFQNLYPVSSFLGKIGNPDEGGIELDEFLRRQQLYHKAELQAMKDVPEFIDKGRRIYGYQHFINDASGSLSELADEGIYETLAKHTLIIYLQADQALLDELTKRAQKQPKPLFYTGQFFTKNLTIYQQQHDLNNIETITPNHFLRWIFPRLVADRLPRYERIADQYGITIDANKLKQMTSEHEVIDLVAQALHQRNG